MNREIKFRAWDESEKRFWIFTLQEILERRMAYRGSWDEKVLRGEKTQFTGLKDKNGKEIYGNDVLQHPEFSGNLLVEFKNGHYTLSGWDCVRTDFSLGEIIGNAFENPGLL